MKKNLLFGYIIPLTYLFAVVSVCFAAPPQEGGPESVAPAGEKMVPNAALKKKMGEAKKASELNRKNILGLFGGKKRRAKKLEKCWEECDREYEEQSREHNCKNDILPDRVIATCENILKRWAACSKACDDQYNK